MIIFEKEYSDESLVDVEQDVYDAVNDSLELPEQDDNGFRPGSFKVTIEWTNVDE